MLTCNAQTSPIVSAAAIVIRPISAPIEMG
jgi:hypothetical protein